MTSYGMTHLCLVSLSFSPHSKKVNVPFKAMFNFQEIVLGASKSLSVQVAHRTYSIL